MAKIMTLLLSLVAAAASAQEFSFQDAAREMLGKNPKLAQSRLQSEASRHQLGAAKAGYWPQLDFVQSWAYSNNPVFAFSTLLNQRRTSAADLSVDALNHPDPVSDVSSQFQLSWLIYDFGKRESRIDSAESGFRIRMLEHQSARLLLLQELVRRYYAVSLAAQRSAVAEEALRSAESRLEQARNRASQGLVVRSDELAAEVFRAGRLQEKIEADIQQKLAMAALNEILGRHSEEMLLTADLREQAFPRFVIDQQKASMMGVNARDISETMQLALTPRTVGLYHRSNEPEDVDVLAQVPRADRSSLEDLLRLKVRSAGGQLVSLSELGNVEATRREQSIYHKNLMPVVYVTADVAGREEGPVYAILKLKRW